MKQLYRDWIDQNVTETYGRCAEVTQQMLDAFPELTRIRGHYYDFAWGEREHWWLVDGDEIIDPTAAQFPSKGRGVYVPLDENQPEPTGMCPNCGNYCYDGNYCCSTSCIQAFMASL